MNVNLTSFIKYIGIFIIVSLLNSCSQSVTNVWDYYTKNNVEQHHAGSFSTSKTKLLYRHQESVNKAQLELIAYKSDTLKYLIIGSHKIAKAFFIYDSIYYFDVNDLYSNVRGNDFIRQLGDLSIFFTHIPANKCEAFLANIDKLKSDFMKGATPEGTVLYFDYNITDDVFVSIEKRNYLEQIENANTYLWVNKRKHIIKLDELVKAMQDFRLFN